MGPAGFDELRFYAEHFDTVEVNTTFYGQPRAEVAADWVRRTPQRFSFSLKLYQKFTHPKMFREAALKSAPGSDGTLLDAARASDAERHRRFSERASNRLQRPASSARSSRSFLRASRAAAATRDYSTQLLTAFSDIR